MFDLIKKNRKVIIANILSFLGITVLLAIIGTFFKGFQSYYLLVGLLAGRFGVEPLSNLLLKKLKIK